MDLIIKPTQRCNFACTFCSSTDIAKSDSKVDDLNLDKIFRFLKRFPETKSIIINGGDPLMMHPKYYWELIDYLDKNNLPTELQFTSNLWDFYKKPNKWIELLRHKRVGVGTSFHYGETRLISDDQVLTEEIFLDIVNKFKELVGYSPPFIGVITKENESKALDTVRLAKHLDTVCRLNYAMASGREGLPYPIGDMYHIYLEIYKEGLAPWEFNTQQMLKRLRGDEFTTCPQNRKCDEGIRNLQPQSDSGYEYNSCGAFGDDQEYGIDFDAEMNGEKQKPLQTSPELSYLKDECLTCPNFNICNGCYKTVRDLKQSGLMEYSCQRMKDFRVKAEQEKLC